MWLIVVDQRCISFPGSTFLDRQVSVSLGRREMVQNKNELKY